MMCARNEIPPIIFNPQVRPLSGERGRREKEKKRKVGGKKETRKKKRDLCPHAIHPVLYNMINSRILSMHLAVYTCTISLKLSGVASAPSARMPLAPTDNPSPHQLPAPPGTVDDDRRWNFPLQYVSELSVFL